MSNEDKLMELLEELVFWTKEAAFPQIRQRLMNTLKTSEEKSAYQLSDGEKTTREVATIINVSQRTVARWWKNWIEDGIAEPIPARGGGHRAKQKFLLKDFGIQVSKNQTVSTKIQ